MKAEEVKEIILQWLRDRHVLHTWSEVKVFHADHVTWNGLFWGWRHRYQLCTHQNCKKGRLVEGFLSPPGQYYLRPGFEAEL